MELYLIHYVKDISDILWIISLSIYSYIINLYFIVFVFESEK